MARPLASAFASAFAALGGLVLPAAVPACGGATAEATPVVTPSSPAQAASPEPRGAPGADPGRAATGLAATPPTEAQGWPYGPALSAEEKKAQLDRLSKDPGPLRTNWTPPGKSERYGRAEGLINAPYDVVKARLEDFTHYKDLAGPKFKKVSVVDKQPGGTDIYFQLPIMKGVVTIWYVTRFAPARPAQGGAEVIEGKFVKGNIKDMQIAFTLRPASEDKQRTVLVCDLNLAINIPAPQAALDEELRDACGDAVNAVRARTTQPPP